MEVREEIVKVRCTRSEKQRIKDLARAEGHADVSALIRHRLFSNAIEAPASLPSLFDESPSVGNPQAVRPDSRSALSGTTSGVGWPE